MRKITKALQKQAKKLGYDLKTSAEMRAERKKEKNDKYNATTLEQRQTFMKALGAGKTIGQSKEIAGIDLDTACEIINRQTQTVKYIDWEVK